MLANIYLHPMDRQMAMLGHRMVRYADDFVVLAPNAREAKRALKDVELLLRGRGLALNREKTSIVPPGQTFSFLGRMVRANCPAPTVTCGGIVQRLRNALVA